METEDRIIKTDEFFNTYGKNLSQSERNTIILRFGMNDGILRTIEEVSQLFGIEKSETNKRIESGLKKLSVPVWGYYLLLYNIVGIDYTPNLNYFFNHHNYSQLKDVIDKTLELLNEKEQKVLQLRFGLLNNENLSLKKVGEALELSGERARQIEQKALRTLRNPKNKKLITEYIESLNNAEFIAKMN